MVYISYTGWHPFLKQGLLHWPASPLLQPQAFMLGGGRLQVDIFIAEWYSTHWMIWVDTPASRPAARPANKTSPPNEAWLPNELATRYRLRGCLWGRVWPVHGTGYSCVCGWHTPVLPVESTAACSSSQLQATACKDVPCQSR